MADASAQDLNGILAQLFRVGPTDEEKKAAFAQALTRGGLGILAANQPSRMPTNPGATLAQGALGGMDSYQAAIDKAQTDRKADAGAALHGLQIKKQMDQQAALAGLLKDDPAAPVASAAAGGTQPQFPAGGPWAPNMPVGQPTAPAGPTLPPGYRDIPLGKLQALAAGGIDPTPFLKVREAAQPKLENVKGIGMVHPTTGQVVASMPTISDNGMTSGLVPDGNGGWRVQVPGGSLDAYRQFQRANEGAKAEFDPVTLQPTSATSAPRIVSRASLFAGAPGAAPASPGGVQSGLSPADTAAQAASAAQKMEVSKNFGGIYNNLQNASMQNPAKIAKYQQIGSLLEGFEGGKLSQAGLDFARTANSAGIKIDPKLPNKEAAAALSGEIALDMRSTSSGGGMPGAMSDADREFLKGMTPNMAQTNEGRKTIISSKVKLLERESKVADMARQYRQKYGQLDDSFFSQLQDWSNRNQLFK